MVLRTNCNPAYSSCFPAFCCKSTLFVAVRVPDSIGISNRFPKLVCDNVPITDANKLCDVLSLANSKWQSDFNLESNSNPLAVGLADSNSYSGRYTDTDSNEEFDAYAHFIKHT